MLILAALSMVPESYRTALNQLMSNTTVGIHEEDMVNEVPKLKGVWCSVVDSRFLEILYQ